VPVNVAFLRIAAVLASALVAFRADAQCEPQWLYHPAQGYPGVNGEVRAITMWDPDGPGPVTPKPLFAGNFTIAGDKPCSNLAWWDGQEWQAFGAAGGENPDSVYSMMVHDGDLHVGGSFAALQGQTLNNIARWDGAAWHPLAEGVKGVVNALSEWNGQLIAGGTFSKAGSQEAHSVARWNGVEWNPVGWGMDGPVHSLCVHNGELYAGGSFQGADFTLCNNIARWDGLQWRRLGPLLNAGVSGPVYALESFEDTLVIGGKFAKAAGVPASNLARWNGTIITPFPATFERASGASDPFIREIVQAQGDLFVAGSFEAVDEVVTGNVARWKKGRWTALGGAYIGATWGGPGVSAMAVDATTGCVIFPGNASIAANAIDVESMVVAFNGETFTSFGQGRKSNVYSMASFKDRLIAVSFFSHLPGRPTIAQWDGNSWTTVGDAPNDWNAALTVYNNMLIVGGHFSQAGGVPVNNIAAWNGSTWSPLGNGIPGKSASDVYDFESYKGDLIACGKFLVEDGAPGNSITRWNGTTWEPLGDGLTKGLSYTLAGSIAAYGGELFVLGSFTDAGGVAVNNAARWNGTGWSSLPTTIGGKSAEYLGDLIVWKDKLVATGNYKAPEWTPFLAEWQSGQWVLLHQADSGGGNLSPLAVFRGELYSGHTS
jgi:hypothetical protein